jgi:hypothetical protein
VNTLDELRAAAALLGAGPDEIADLVARPTETLKSKHDEYDWDAYERDRVWVQWKARQMARFRTMPGRRAAVAVLERAITGTETSVPEGVLDALAMLMQSLEPDLRHPERPLGDPAPIMLYEDLRREYSRQAKNAKRGRRS